MRKISVIIPVYNSEKYISCCLDSVINTSYPNLEILCVDDGSTDHSHSILKEYSEKDSRIKVINQENSGVSSARNKGLKNATGEVIAFLDADDCLHPCFFELMLKAMTENDADIVECNYIRTNSDIFEFTEIKDFQGFFLDKKNLYRRLASKAYVWGKLWKASVINDIQFASDIVIAEDYLFNVSVIQNNIDIHYYYLDVALYKYRDNISSAIYQTDEKERMRFVQALALLSDQCSSNVISDKYLLLSIIRQVVSERYRCKIISGYQDENYKICNYILKQCFVKLNGYFSKETVKWYLFYLFPDIYRMGRNIKDPDMRVWEKLEKQKRNGKKQLL